VTFQTCILQDGNSSWGRLFITAVPVPLMNQVKFQALEFNIGPAYPIIELISQAPNWDLHFR